MKFSAFLRSIATLFVIISLFATPLVATAAAGKKGEKNFKQGLKHEVAEQWDKAAEEFALAVAANPGNSEYRLHYRRALFNASQMMVMRGRTLADQKDFVGAYNAYRQAYGYDPTNELAKAEMQRMIRLQQGDVDPDDPNKPKESPTVQPPGVKLVPTAYNAGSGRAQDNPPQVEQLREIKYTRQDLKTIIKLLAQDLDLNVLFDSETFRSPREFSIELKDVTTAQALDAVFLQEGLFFQRVGRRMILVANQNRRQNFQQLVLRTFYLSNAKPEDVRNVLTQAIPPQPGRPPVQAIIDKDTNSVTVRDTTENLRIISNLIRALDKDRAEVVMDVNIYEVSKSDLLQLGNQVGSEGSLTSLGGSSSGVVGIGGSDIFGRVVSGAAQGAVAVPQAIATGIILPAANLTAFQSKSNTRLLASTQVHAFNNEESQARIGQRVPVQTAQLLGINTQAGQGQANNNGFFGNPANVINYEQVGLTLKFTPIVFPNQDVQVKMSIESKDVVSTGATPSFSERSISGTARIQNNRTLLLASVAQDAQTTGRAGLPFLGLIPVLGRLFTAPRRDNRQVDIVIAVTPRVLRAPSIMPEDEKEQPTGSISQPTSSSLAEMLEREDQEDQLAAARRLSNTAVVQLPDQQSDAATPSYTSSNPAAKAIAAQQNSATSLNSAAGATTARPIDSSAVKTLSVTPTAEKVNNANNTALETEQLVDAQAVKLTVAPLGQMRAGEKRRVAIRVNSPLEFQTAILSLAYDSKRMLVSQIHHGEIFGNVPAQLTAQRLANSGDTLLVSLPAAPNQAAKGSGVLAYFEVEALTDGNASFAVNANASRFISRNGEDLSLQLMP